MQKPSKKYSSTFFNDALTLYVDELSRGELTLETINHLEAAVDALEANIGDNNYAIEIEGERFKSLMKSIFDYTNRLAKANNFKTPSNVVSFFKKTPTDLASLKDCLVTQREILQNAA